MKAYRRLLGARVVSIAGLSTDEMGGRLCYLAPMYQVISRDR
jgi:hypothetical protein